MVVEEARREEDGPAKHSEREKLIRRRGGEVQMMVNRGGGKERKGRKGPFPCPGQVSLETET